MSVITEEKENNKVFLDAEDLEYKIEIATQILDRNIGFVTNCDNKDLLNDLIEQIYINAEIASNKYATYNRGLILTIVGFVFFVMLLLIGIYIY